jgi:HSP20 family molecular chaperone IbpA
MEKNTKKKAFNKDQKANQSQNQALSKRDESTSPFSLIDSFFSDDMWDPFSVMSPRLLGGRRLGNLSGAFPKVDVEETEKEIKVTANIPGVDPDKIDVEVGDDYISLSGRVEKEERRENSQGKVYRYERNMENSEESFLCLRG